MIHYYHPYLDLGADPPRGPITQGLALADAAAGSSMLPHEVAQRSIRRRPASCGAQITPSAC